MRKNRTGYIADTLDYFFQMNKKIVDGDLERELTFVSQQLQKDRDRERFRFFFIILACVIFICLVDWLLLHFNGPRRANENHED